MAHRREFRNLTNLSEADRRALLDQMDGSSRAEHVSVCESGRNARAHERFEYRATEVAVVIEHPGGGVACLLMAARNLSASGMSLLHGGFLHKHTRCRVLLQQLSGSGIAVAGSVVAARLVRGSLHEICVRFDRSIDVAEFMSPQQMATGRLENLGSLADLNGRVLYVSEISSPSDVFTRTVKRSRIELTSVPATGPALDAARLNRFDVVVIEPGVRHPASGSFLTDFRAAGHAGPVVALIGATEPRTEENRPESLGATHTFREPYGAKDLLRFLRDRMAESPQSASTMTLDLGSIEQVTTLVTRLSGALQRANETEVRMLCLAAKDAAAGSERQVVREAAEQALRTLATASLTDAAPGIRALMDECSRIAAAPRPPAR